METDPYKTETILREQKTNKDFTDVIFWVWEKWVHPKNYLLWKYLPLKALYVHG